MKRENYSSGVEWEERFGYSRAVRVGERILVAGTTATGPQGLVGGEDPRAQARYALEKIQTAVEALGGRLEDVVRTRVFVSRIEDWEAVAAVRAARSSLEPAGNVSATVTADARYIVPTNAQAQRNRLMSALLDTSASRATMTEIPSA